jgi:hypothetical protein
MSSVAVNMIAMEKEEPQTTTSTTISHENWLQMNVQLLHNICQNFEDLNKKIDRIELKVTLVERKVTYAFDYMSQSDPEFKSHIKQQVEAQFTQHANRFEEEQMRQAIALSLQERGSMEAEKEKKQ